MVSCTNADKNADISSYQFYVEIIFLKQNSSPLKLLYIQYNY